MGSFRENGTQLDISTRIKLNNGVEMPLFGLGVFQAKVGGEVENAVKTALNHGYRKIDTATAYRNERGVGNGIKMSSIPREEVFLTSKVRNEDQGYHSTLAAFEKSLDELQTDYLDLYLIHWPRGKRSLGTWKAMEELYKKERIRAIGVSNFLEYHLEDLLRTSEVIPAINQVEYHPELLQPELYDYCKSRGIQFQAWRPIMQGKVNNIEEICALADKYGKTPVQITLRWNVQKKIPTIPKSVKEERIISNADIYDFQLSKEDIQSIDKLNKNKPLVPYQYKISFLIRALFIHKPKLHLTKLLVHSFTKKTQKAFYYLFYKRYYLLFLVDINSSIDWGGQPIF
ncbi:aldo/keto reductase [Maribellus comscasis]|uniref:Aldo/keto reductase n=1 Tax=Maribellus comscasis TaxID=2681766 RepID=A0A6I6JUS1_9BACT|nr:aldo/keto reductase [Maribellus comscasis]QGY43927.1 aldo/keto reductase [Maribellus comscasis]